MRAENNYLVKTQLFKRDKLWSYIWFFRQYVYKYYLYSEGLY